MSKDSRLQAAEEKPVYMTRMVGARLTGVNDRTFEKHAVPSAWRREHDGKLSPLYDDAAVEAFRIAYRPKIAGRAL
jgi:hypothetical protein